MTYIHPTTWHTQFVEAKARHQYTTLKLAIDYETNSNVKLKDTGLGPYGRDPGLQVLMVGLAFRNLAGELVSTCYDLEHPKIMEEMVKLVIRHAVSQPVYAHNSQFEMVVTQSFVGESPQIRDSAVLARVFGANSHLKWAGPQLVGEDKLTSGEEFIKTFCLGVPRQVTMDYVRSSMELQRIWSEGKVYCANDAEVSFLIGEKWDYLPAGEWDNFFLTCRMNARGWLVDHNLVHDMQLQRDINTNALEQSWRNRFEPTNAQGKPLNLRSPVQVKWYLKELGYDVKSTDKVAMKRLSKTAQLRPMSPNKAEVMALIAIKHNLGGTSLSKLETIDKQVCDDQRVRYQYSHCGAGQSWRTSGVGIQMQNLKRLGDKPGNMQLVHSMDNNWLAENLRQVFHADDGHFLLVSDLSSIEARVLAWLAWEEWKLEAFRQGIDVYKLLARDIHAIPNNVEVSKEERSHGKVGELGGGYGMGAAALQSYAEKMEIELTLEQCKTIIDAYRGKNLRIRQLWYSLNTAMVAALQGQFADECSVQVGPPGSGYSVVFTVSPETDELNAVMTGTVMLNMAFMLNGITHFWRVWRGCYLTQGTFGSEVVYHKSPVSPNSGRLWADHSVDEETGAVYKNKLYGGKLTGVLVQSFARQLFFQMMQDIETRLPADSKLIGQFHDEVVVDVPAENVETVRSVVEHVMERSMFEGLPVGCEVKHAYAYIK